MALHPIYTCLLAWALDHGGKFPDRADSANSNFRELFVSRLLDTETLFGIPGDGWCQKGKPDGNIGQAPEYAEALEAGELSIAYIAGLDQSSGVRLPIMIAGAGPATAWITGVEKKAPEHPFTGGVWVAFVSGSVKLMHPDNDGKIREDKDGVRMDIFSREWGSNPDNVRLPAGVQAKPAVPE